MKRPCFIHFVIGESVREPLITINIYDENENLKDSYLMPYSACKQLFENLKKGIEKREQWEKKLK